MSVLSAHLQILTQHMSTMLSYIALNSIFVTCNGVHENTTTAGSQTHYAWRSSRY